MEEVMSVEEGSINCGDCSAVLSIDEKFCGECGTAVPVEEDSTPVDEGSAVPPR